MRNLIKIIFISIFLFIFVGCAGKVIEKEVIVKKNVPTLILPSKELTKKVIVPEPIPKDLFLAMDRYTREKYLVNYNLLVMKALKKANYKLKGIRVFNYLTQRRLRKER